MTLFLVFVAFFIGAGFGAFAMALGVCAANSQRDAEREMRRLRDPARYPKEIS